MCVCSEVKRIHNSSIQGEDEYFYLKDDIEKFLSQLHTLLSKSRGISRDLKYQVKCKRSISQDRSNRAAPIFEADFDDTRQKFLYDQWKEDPQRFWTPESTPFKPTGDAQISLLQDPIYSALNDFLRSDQNEVHQLLHRRVTSIVVHILSRVVPDKYGGGSITTKFHQAKLFPDVSECDLRKTIDKLDNHGKTWISIGHRLGAGAIWSLPWNVPLSAWTRLPLTDDDQSRPVTRHLQKKTGARAKKYCEFVKRLICLRIQPIIGDISRIQSYLPPNAELIEARQEDFLTKSSHGAVRGLLSERLGQPQIQPSGEADVGRRRNNNRVTDQAQATKRRRVERAPQTRSHSANFEDEPSPSRCLLANSTFTIGGTADMSASGPSGFSQEAVERATESDAGIATVAGDSNLGSSIAASGVQLDWQGMPDDIKHLQKHNLEPSNLLLLLYHLAGCACPIERELLTYCGKPKMRWTQSGEQELFSARNLGLDAKVMILLQDETLERSLTLLETYRLIKRDSRKIALERKSARCIESLIGSQGQVSNYWKRQTFILTCFFFAGSEFSHKFSTIGRSAVSYFGSRLIETIRVEHLLDELREVAVDALLQASKFSTISWKTDSVNVAQDIGRGLTDPCIQMRLALRRSTILRVAGNIADSDGVIKEFLSTHTELIQRLTHIRQISPEEGLNRIRREIDQLRETNAVHGLLVGSQAMNLFEREQFYEAVKVFQSWKALPTLSSCPQISTHEAKAQARQLALLGLISLNAGWYSKARVELECAIGSFHEDDTTRLEAMANLGDAYCELGRPQEALHILDGVITKKNSRHSLSTKPNRSLLLSYAEACICTARYEQAENDLQPLKRYFEALAGIERYDQRRHIRTLFLLAESTHLQAMELSQWTETMQRWDAVLKLASTYAMSTDGWDFGMVCFSTCDAARRIGFERESVEWFQRGTTIFGSKGHFWRRGMTTYWRQFISTQMPEIQTVKGFPWYAEEEECLSI